MWAGCPCYRLVFPFLLSLNRDKEIHALNKILSFSDKRHSFESLLPKLSSKLLIEFLLFKAKQKVKRLIKRV
ncbi:glycosyltransferase family 8 protein [Helicobacter pylori]|uniref:glycosyltransferase family 8 protein n=1 Tax=Helicobacter pylori TaxID=210 RepID=UPI0035316474